MQYCHYPLTPPSHFVICCVTTKPNASSVKNYRKLTSVFIMSFVNLCSSFSSPSIPSICSKNSQAVSVLFFGEEKAQHTLQCCPNVFQPHPSLLKQSPHFSPRTVVLGAQPRQTQIRHLQPKQARIEPP